MTSAFQSLKNSRLNVEQLKEKMSTSNTSRRGEKDVRMWEPTVDKAGNGLAIIRFLPASKGEDAPYIKVYSHGFQRNGKWYIEECPTTLGVEHKCPVCELNKTLWNSGSESDKLLVQGVGGKNGQKRQLNFVSNVLVQDPANPDNNGKVFLYKYGSKIWDKINAALNAPVIEGEEAPIQPFDFWDGANFKLIIAKKDGFRNYDQSNFSRATSLFEGNEDKLSALWESQYSLNDFLKPTGFKAYDQLDKRLQEVSGGSSTGTAASRLEDEEDEVLAPVAEAPAKKSAPAKKLAAKPAAQAPVELPADDDETSKYFQDLLNN
jgi:hypothetical protein